MSDADSPDRHIAAAKSRLVHLSGLAEKTDAAERKILDAATDRLQTVESDLAKLRPRVNLDDSAGDQYQALTIERGQLALTIERAKQVLGA